MKKITFEIILILLSTVSLWAQHGDPTLLKTGKHTGNRVGISFHNDGAISGIIPGVDIRGEWPLGTGYNYIGDLTPLIGVEFVNSLDSVLHSVCISRGPRKGQADEKSPIDGHFWGFNPIPGYCNTFGESPAMSHLPDSWPIEGWGDLEHKNWKDPKTGKTQWWGYFGRGIMNADQESFYIADDNLDDEFNAYFKPDPTDPTRLGMGLQLTVRGMQWSNALAENCIFWLYDIKNEGKTLYKKANFGTVVGTLAGGDGDSQDDLGFFDVHDWITYSYDSDNRGNKGQKVGWVGYAFLESPGNPYDGIDNDNDSQDPSNENRFTVDDFDTTRVFKAGDQIVLIDPVTYERSLSVVKNRIDTVYSLGHRFIIVPGVTRRCEGWISGIDYATGQYIPDQTANDGLDNDLDGLIDENEVTHLMALNTKINVNNRPTNIGVHYINYFTGLGKNDPLIDEKRDNDAGGMISSYCPDPSGGPGILKTHWAGDENGNWDASRDDVGSDGIGPYDLDYPGPDKDGSEGNGRPDQGEPNFGKTDPDESDQIGLTAFNFFELQAGPDLSKDEDLWFRMTPGRFDVVPAQPQDGDFIYASGYFPLAPGKTERFSTSIVFGDDHDNVINNKRTVQTIYNDGYRFAQPPQKPTLTLTQQDGNVVLYWDGTRSENSYDLVTKTKDFEGYKIYRATDVSFLDARTITNNFGVLSFDKPLAQFDLVDSVKGFFYPSPNLLRNTNGLTYYLGSDNGIVHKFVDSTVVKGMTYYYAVVSYDKGWQLDASDKKQREIFPTENSKFIFRDASGKITTDVNTGYITPGARPVGYTNAKVADMKKSTKFLGSGSIDVNLVDEKAVKNNSYKIVFSDSAYHTVTSNWSLINAANNDTLVKKSNVFYGETPIVDGFRIQMVNQGISIDMNNSGFQAIKDSANLPQVFLTPVNSKFRVPNDYLIEFLANDENVSVADTIDGEEIPTSPVNVKIKNLTTDKYINFSYIKVPGLVSTNYYFFFKEKMDDNRLVHTWDLNFRYPGSLDLEKQGKYRISTTKPFASTDTLTFTMSVPKIDNIMAANSLDKIKVVPNPYVVTHIEEAKLPSGQTSGRGERFIRFTHVPPGAKISIYTVRGELVKTLEATDLFQGDVKWNLRTEENLDAAFGVYVFVVDAPGIGSKTGKFALIK